MTDECENKLNKPGQSGSGSGAGYSVEARYNYVEPVTIDGITLDNRWRRIWFSEGSAGIPAYGRTGRGLRETNLYSYEGAQALRWWFIAIAGSQKMNTSLCLETRIVQHRVRWSYSETPVAYVDETKYGEPRLPPEPTT